MKNNFFIYSSKGSKKIVLSLEDDFPIEDQNEYENDKENYKVKGNDCVKKLNNNSSYSNQESNMFIIKR